MSSEYGPIPIAGAGTYYLAVYGVGAQAGTLLETLDLDNGLGGPYFADRPGTLDADIFYPCVVYEMAGSSADPIADTPVRPYTFTAGPVLQTTDDISDLQSDIANLDFSGATITNQSPITDDGEFNPLVRGDDYLDADGRALIFHLLDHGMDLAGATAKLTLVDTHYQVDDLTITGQITIDDTAGDADLAFELTSTQTTALLPGINRYEWDIQLTLASGSQVTPVRGELTVYRSYTPPG